MLMRKEAAGEDCEPVWALVLAADMKQSLSRVLGAGAQATWTAHGCQ
jgi:hypothetical protein